LIGIGGGTDEILTGFRVEEGGVEEVFVEIGLEVLF
jgi:hypothetical protein